MKSLYKLNLNKKEKKKENKISRSFTILSNKYQIASMDDMDDTINSFMNKVIIIIIIAILIMGTFQPCTWLDVTVSNGKQNVYFYPRWLL